MFRLFAVHKWLAAHDIPVEITEKGLKMTLTVPLPPFPDAKCECWIITFPISGNLVRFDLAALSKPSASKRAPSCPQLQSKVRRSPFDFSCFSTQNGQLVFSTQATFAFIEDLAASYLVDSLLQLCRGTVQQWFRPATSSLCGIKKEMSMDDEDSEGGDQEAETLSLKILKSEGLYVPLPSLEGFFIPFTAVCEAEAEYFTVESPGWKKVYTNREIHIKQITDFWLSLYDSGVCFTIIPWDWFYCREAGASWEVRLAVGLQQDCVAKDRVDKRTYHLQVMEEWTKETERWSDKGKLGILLNIQTMQEVPYISADKFGQGELDSPSLVLGHGGFAYVYLNTLGREKVVLKGFNPQKVRSANNLVREAQMMVKVRHENIVKILGVTEYKGKLMIVLERCNYSMKDAVQKRKNVVNDWHMHEKLKILRNIADAVAALHKHKEGICHFDLKPENILFKEVRVGKKIKFVPKITDFGLASLRQRSDQWQRLGFTIGYSSPEQLQGINCGPHSDVWSFSMLSFFFLTHVPPFNLVPPCNDGANKKRTMQELFVQRRKPIVRQQFEREHPKVVGLLRQCWHSNESARPTMKQVRDTLEILRMEYKSQRMNVDRA